MDFFSFFFESYKLFLPNISDILGFISIILYFYLCTFLGFLIIGSFTLSYNFFIGCSLNIFFSIIFFIFFKTKIIFSYYIFIVLVLFFIFKKIKKFIIFNYILKNKFNIFFTTLIFLVPLFLIIFNSQAYGWDTFAHWLPMVQKLIDPLNVQVEGNAKYYPIGSSIILVNSTLLNNGIFSENVSAIFNFILGFFIIEFLFKKFSHFIKNNRKIFKVILVPLVFYNPIIMNKFVFTAYNDFASAIVTFFIFFKISDFFKNKKVNINEIFIIFSLIVILTSLKNTGFVMSIFLIFSFLITYSIFETKKIFFFLKYSFIFIFPAIFLYFLWQYYLFHHNIFTEIIIYKNLRIEKIVEFFSSLFFKEIFERKFFYFSSFLFFSLIFLKESHKKFYYYYFSYFLLFLFWNGFLIFIYVFHFGDYALESALEFWRYSSHLSFVIFYLLLNFFIFISKNIKVTIKQRYKFFLYIFIIIFPIVYVDKYRRDLNYQNLQIRSAIKNINYKDKPILFIGTNSQYNANLINYYLTKDYNQKFVIPVESKEINLNFLFDYFNNKNINSIILSNNDNFYFIKRFEN